MNKFHQGKGDNMLAELFAGRVIYVDGDVLATGGGATCMDSGWHALVQG